MDQNINNALIQKYILHAGSRIATFSDGSRVFFHFQTKKCDEDGTVLDDSRKMGQPMELVLGKKFKFEVWEKVVQMMAIGEVAKFRVHKSLACEYPFVAKTLRDAGKPQNERRHHCCGVTLQNEGIGYPDLNELIKEPCDLEFIIELLKVEAPHEYEKKSWQMNEQEKLQAVPELREAGNRLYGQKDYAGAADKYALALGILEQLMLSEKPHDEEWNALNQLKIPLLLNFAQCKLHEKDYYTVIEHCSTVLGSDPNNVKALFRRAKAHVGAWNPREAHADFERVAELDQSLVPAIKKEVKFLEDLEKQRNDEDKEKYKGKIF
ncbi:AH receptor-interacting protein [Anabrus simplex]|uniref:AH receptor-interacting protein n=1 Tax=Anabrus simplex TaxID=316456 RepID=UPI0034DD105A